MQRIFVALAFLLAGCPAQDNGGGPHDMAAMPVDDMTAGGDDLARSSGPHDFATPIAANNGGMEVISTSMSWSGAASFYTGMVPTTSPDCTSSDVGSCTAVHCIIGSGDGGTTGTYATVSAGDVAVSVGTAAPIAFSAQPGNYYVAPGSNAQSLFAGGETLTFTTSGAVAPASTTTVQAPTPPTLTTPASPPYTISRNSDFALAWSGGGPGQLSVSIQTNVSSTAPGTVYGGVLCRFAISDGSGVIPIAALAVLPTGSAAVRLLVSNQSVHVIADWALTATAGTYPHTPGGQETAGGQATIN